MQAGIFWGNDLIHKKEDPIICEKEEVERICERLIIDVVKHEMPSKGYATLIPGYFHIVSGGKKQIMGLKIQDVIKKGMSDKFLPSFLFFTGLYDAGLHEFRGSQEDNFIALNITGLLRKKSAVSIRLDEGIVMGLRKLEKNKMAEFIHVRISKLILNRYFRLGNLKERLGHFFVAFDYPHLMVADNKGFMVGDSSTPQLQYQKNGKLIFVNYSLNNYLIKALKKISKAESKTVTSLIEQAICDQH